MSTATLTFYRVSEKRGAVPEDLEGGVVVHDHFQPYYGLTGVAHAYCNAHHLRELKALIEIDAEPWARDMSDCSSRAARRCAWRGKNETFAPIGRLEAFVTRYRRAVRAACLSSRQRRPLNQCAKDGQNAGPVTICSNG